MKKILIAASVASMVDQFLMPYIKDYSQRGWKIVVATNFDNPGNITHERAQKLIEVLNILGVTVEQIDFARSPLAIKNAKAYMQLKAITEKEKFDIIDTHSPIGGLLARVSAKKSKQQRDAEVFYTAHGFHFFNGGSKLNWLIYYPIEKILSKYTDVLITINKEDYQLAKQKFHSQKIEYIPGVGVDVKKFAEITCDIKAKKRELNIKEHEIVLLSVGELNKNKNHEVIIRAIKSLGNPQLRYIIVGKGELSEYLQNLIEKLNLTEQVQLLGYRTDIHELCQICNVFCFPSYREGLGLAAVEALSAGKPLITSTTRGIDDYSIDGVTGFKSKDYSIDGFVQAIQNYLDNRNNFDAELLKKQADRFSKEEVQQIMQRIYMEAVHEKSKKN